MDGGDNFVLVLTIYFPADRQNHVSQNKTFVVSEGNHVAVTSNIHVNRMVIWLERNISKTAAGVAKRRKDLFETCHNFSYFECRRTFHLHDPAAVISKRMFVMGWDAG
jgi:hypothetical protein